MDHKKHEIWALCVLTVTLLVLFSLVSYRSSDLTFFSASTAVLTPKNWVGSFGANIAWSLLFVLGLGAYVLPLIGLWAGICLFRGAPALPLGRLQAVGFVLLVLSGICLLALYAPRIHLFGQPVGTGGRIGEFYTDFFLTQLGSVGTAVLLVGTFLVSLVLSTPFTLRATLEWLCRSTFMGGKAVCRGVAYCCKNVRLPARKSAEAPPPPIEEAAPRVRPSRRKKEALPPPEEVMETLPPPAPMPEVVPVVKAKEKKGEVALAVRELPPGSYTLPSIDLLDTYESEDHRPDPKKLEANATVLEEKLKDFGVQGKVGAINPGPVITMYEYAPAPGIKISRIVGLSDDLTMALKATSIRVVAPIPGKAAVGIEIPNKVRALVSIRAILSAEVFTSSTTSLTIALGKDIMGEPTVANLAKMPHLLIAGATGTGKSVCINTILSSLLYRNTPDDLRLLLVDPKRIELSTYEGIPHLIHPVVTEPKLATKALQWAVQEMELRYRLLADKNARSIEGYNKTLEKEAKEAGSKPAEDASDEEPQGLRHHRLPYMVIIIDELADLMMVASREVEEYITRLAQMARAAGIHLILATQRPSVDVLTGIIKANVPTRISFQVSSKIDSRTILDGMGAENLLGAGDMLFLPPGTAKIQRIHGAFISDAEVQRLTEFWKAQQVEDDPFRERVNFQDQSSSDELSAEDVDEKYDEAVEIVLETRQASISMIQRRLRVGYNRAARMIEVMEQQGLVAPSDGVKPREVIGRR